MSPGDTQAPREPTPPGGWRVRTVLVALDASRSSRAVAAAAAELAAALSAELAGLFVEDSAVARAATLPGSWEIGSFAATRPPAGNDLQRLHVPIKKVMPFVMLPGHHPGNTLDATQLAQQLAPSSLQGALF